MVGLSQEERTKKAEYLEILDETIRTNPYRKAATAMACVMAKHGIESNTSKALGRPRATTPEKRCALSRSLRLAQNCNIKLNVIRDDLQNLCSQLKTESPPSDGQEKVSEKTGMAGHLLTLIGEAETIAKRIYETAVGLHVAEDFLRQPEDLKLLDFSTNGRIQIPNYNFNHASQLCLEWLYSTAFKWLRGFKEEVNEENSLFINIFENFTKAVKDYTEAVCLANQVFRVLLYPNASGKRSLQEYVMSLGHVLKNDMIMELQALRRAFDNVQTAFERIGWAASIAWMKYSGKNITVENLNENGIQVDHSSFHYKFYEGPDKISKKFVRAIKKEKSVKKIKSRNLKKGSSLKSLSGDMSKTNETKELKKKDSVSGANPQDTSLVSVFGGGLPPLKRLSKSVSDVSTKSKKAVKKKVKAKKPIVLAEPECEVEAYKSFLKPRHSEGVHAIGDSNKTEESEKPNGTGKSALMSQQLIPPPKIPSAIRLQFNAVFGTYGQRKTGGNNVTPKNKSSGDLPGRSPV